MVLPEDKSPPILQVSSKVWIRYVTANNENYLMKPLFITNEPKKYCSLNNLQFQNGFVFENSPVGTKVVDAEGNEISFEVTDADHDAKV